MSMVEYYWWFMGESAYLLGFLYLSDCDVIIYVSFFLSGIGMNPLIYFLPRSCVAGRHLLGAQKGHC